jgi:hypothetical protein
MTPPQKTQWEYYVETVGSAFSSPKDEELEEILNEMGEQGWQVFSLGHLPNSPKIRFVARRTIDKATRGKRDWPG